MSDKSEACPICGMPVGADVNEYNKKLEAESTTPVETMPQQNNTMVSQGNQPADNVSENNPPATPPPPSQPKPEQPKKKSKTGLIIGIVVGVLAVAALTGFLVIKNKKDALLKEQMLIEQLTDPNSHPWLHGEWRNGVYGDILNVYSDGVKFIKNGLVIEEDWYEDMSPLTIENLVNNTEYTDKVPFKLIYEKNTADDTPLLSLQFDNVVSNYPSKVTERLVIYLDTDNLLLYYFDPNGKKVFLDKYSDNTFEERWDKELEKARKQLAEDFANHKYDWLYGTWLDFDGELVIVGQDYVYIGNDKQPFNLHYKLEDPYSEALGYGLYLYLCNINVEPSMHSMYWADEFSFYEYQKVSDATEPVSEVYSGAQDMPAESYQQSNGNVNQFVVIDGSQLRLRLGPSTSYDTFKWPDGTNRHPNVGDRFKYLGESGDFYKIDFNGNEVWVSKQYSHLE